jgi:hypothetical protein
MVHIPCETLCYVLMITVLFEAGLDLVVPDLKKICWIRDWFSNFNPTPLISFDLLGFSIFGLAGKQRHSSGMLVVVFEHPFSFVVLAYFTLSSSGPFCRIRRL